MKEISKFNQATLLLNRRVVPVRYARVIWETDKAFLIRFQNAEVWVAKKFSYLDDDKKIVNIPIWLVKKHKLDENNT